MAKLETVVLKSIPEVINVGDDINDITIITKIEFHPIDVSLKMEYLLHLLVYDVHGKPDVPVIINNWDESEVIGLKQENKDDFLGRQFVPICADERIKTIETPIALKLGDLKDSGSFYKRKLEVLATLIPAIGRATKWSEPFECDLVY